MNFRRPLFNQLVGLVGRLRIGRKAERQRHWEELDALQANRPAGTGTSQTKVWGDRKTARCQVGYTGVPAESSEANGARLLQRIDLSCLWDFLYLLFPVPDSYALKTFHVCGLSSSFRPQFRCHRLRPSLTSGCAILQSLSIPLPCSLCSIYLRLSCVLCLYLFIVSCLLECKLLESKDLVCLYHWPVSNT